ncbi:amidohydrolase family protein [Terrisporobacter mayombei]|nr:amidohydrolase family protein [Terrisporobacter mayombei]
MIFIKNATINTITEGIIIGNLLIENKKIKEIGNDIVAPLDATVIDAKGCLVLPGFIDAHTHLGLWEDGMATEGIDGNEQTDPITPQLNTIDAINPMDITFNEAVKSGITSVCSTPGSANPIGGQAIALKTYGKIVDKMVIKNNRYLYILVIEY